MIRQIATLARWLGPWADKHRAPDVATRDTVIAGIRTRIYGNTGTPFLIAPGLHYAGADDPRMDRFCRILAAAGHLVYAPFIPDYLALLPGDGAKRDFLAVLRALPDKPVVFSISFGSLLALAAAADAPDRVERLVLFGGYADFPATMRYCLAGAGRDPLNQPVVMLNLIPQLAPADPDALAAGWRRYVEATWGRPELKAPARFTAIAEALAPDVPESVRELFLVGIGARPGAAALGFEALTRFDARPLDPTPYLSRITCRVDLVHGTDDDVIEYAQSHALAARLPHANVHITGLYDHTGAQFPRPSALLNELRTMFRVLRVLS